MTYELAKELKDAGFPNSEAWEDVRGQTCIKDAHGFYQSVPDLCELIEACTKEPSAFILYIRGDTQKWYASSSMGKSSADDVEGSTPEEAVAKLWIALNTHPSNK